ncbi:hypothetical protein CR970_04290 [Candidatus Saccharibacteria bacterium]|nr:MAG: hypothetical protein CR970_04290 [Candidatus Saccharibacteria bacterium]
MLRAVRRLFGKHATILLILMAMAIAAALESSDNQTAAKWLLTIVAVGASVRPLWGMIDAIRHGGYGVNALAIIAIIAAVVQNEYWVAACLALLLVATVSLENYAKQRAAWALNKLTQNTPTKAHLLRGAHQKDVKPADIQPGDKLVVLAGEQVPVDGEILDGSSTLDESILTGNTDPAPRRAGEIVYAGTTNTENKTTVSALRTAADSHYRQNIRSIRAASKSYSPFARLAAKFSIPFSIVALVVAVVAWVVSGDSTRFLMVVSVASPSALLLGAPIAMSAGLSRAVQQGIIPKTAAALEQLAYTRAIAFGGNGTLTDKPLTIRDVQTFGKHTRQNVLQYAAALEAHANHTIASAIVEAAQEPDQSPRKAKQVKETIGQGIAGRLDGKTVLVGSAHFLDTHGISMPESFRPSSLRHTAALVAINDELAGVITLDSHIDPQCAPTLQRLHQLKTGETILLSSAPQANAEAIAQKLAVDQTLAECQTRDKIMAIEKSALHPLVFAGDSASDTPVLTASDIGIALGALSCQTPADSANVLVMEHSFAKLAEAVAIAKQTLRIAFTAVLFGTITSLLLIGVFATGQFHPLQAVALNAIITLLVVLYALRARKSRS